MEDRVAAIRAKLEAARELNLEAVEVYSGRQGKDKEERGDDDPSKSAEMYRRKRQRLGKNSDVLSSDGLSIPVSELQYQKSKYEAKRGLNASQHDPESSLFKSFEKRALRCDEENQNQNPIDIMKQDLIDTQKKRHSFSRRREFSGAHGSINERNLKFNKKLERAFDQHTQTTKQNLERGTALPRHSE